MKNQVLFVGILFSLFGAIMGNAQELKTVKTDTLNGKTIKHMEVGDGDYDSFLKLRENEITALNNSKAVYEATQREQLAAFVKTMNESVLTGKISEQKSEKLKQEQAALTAARIQKHNEAVDSQIEFVMLKDSFVSNKNTLNITTNGFNLEIDSSKKKIKKEVFTTSEGTISIGYNFMSGNTLNIDDFGFADKNNYFALGRLFKTRLDKNNVFRIKYGLEYQSHGTELNGNRVFSVNGASTQLTDLTVNAKKAKFRQDQLVIPFHLEIGGTKKKEYEDGRIRFYDDSSWKLGLGGFAGFNLSSRLKLKYEADGRDIKETIVNAFDTQPFVYGLDAYVGKGGITAFGRMNFNDVFKSGSVDAQYVTFGIRFQI